MATRTIFCTWTDADTQQKCGKPSVVEFMGDGACVDHAVEFTNSPFFQDFEDEEEPMPRTLDEIIQHVETNLDPEGLIRQDFINDPEHQQDINGYAAAVVAELDDCWDEGAEITPDEMAKYLWRLADLAENERA
jgi:hypothetical protein